ncbi:MAG: hypothetical protein IJ382_06760 [Flavobacteriales bacterium]|jgi:hypothetical protein|nr:hypothetical protein [Flavobacteriales bacterium]PWM12122.1 MAG: hypothetical protein DBY00_03510 [Flavobacteriales bacterium]
MEIVYKIDGHDFKDYGVYVSASHGLIGGLKPKKRVEVEWDDCNGYQTDDTPMYFEARNISLNCFLKASGAAECIEKSEAFARLFYTASANVLTVSAGGKTLSYNVRLADAIDVQKTFAEGTMTAVFTLRLVEPEPSLPVVS